MNFLKHKRLLALPVAACIGLCCGLVTACSGDGSKNNDGKEGGLSSMGYYMYAMDTNVTLCVTTDFSDPECEEEADNFAYAVKDVLSDIERSISASVESSYVNAFNEAEPGATVEIDEICYDVLKIAIETYNETGGYYNPGVYYSADLYGFAPRVSSSVKMPYDRSSAYSLPEEKYVTAFQELSKAFSDVEIGVSYDGTYYAVKPEKTVTVEGDSNVYSLKIDLGGIGKGYATDVVDKMFEDMGYKYGYFFFGSSSIVVQKCYASKNDAWDLSYEDPRGSGYYLESDIMDATLSTSGDNKQYFEVGGKRYCHIMDPTTGSSIQTGIISCTVIGDSAAAADAYTTGLMAMGLEKAIEFINENLKGDKVVFVYEKDSQYYVICNDLEYFKIVDSKYSFGNTLDGDGNIVLMDNVN